MMKVLLVLCLLLSGCSRKDNQDEIIENNNEEAVVEENVNSEMFTKRDLNESYEKKDCVLIEFNGNSAKASSDSVKVSSGVVSITEEADYYISGDFEGKLEINSDENAKIHLIFDGIHITNANSAALNIVEADKVVITLVENTENSLVSNGDFKEDKIDGALFSKQDLTINGKGSLDITSNNGHGIVCKDDLVLINSQITVACANDGFDVNDSVRVKNANIEISSGKDGIQCEHDEDVTLGFVYIENGTFDITAEGDGISSSSNIDIIDGNFNLLCGGGSENGTKSSSNDWGGFMGGRGPGGRPDFQKNQEVQSTEASTSMKGIKANKTLNISNGTFNINSADDALHSNDTLTIENGTFEIESGDDAVHAEETLTINNGTMNISECYEGLEALHVKVVDGNIKMVASDDGINAAGGNDESGMGGRDQQFGGGFMSSNSNGSIVISGGTLFIESSGDGMDANGTLEITGGHITIIGPTQGDTATLDFDKTATISNATFIGTGSSMMAQTFDQSNQGIVAVQVGSQAAETKIILKDSNGKEIFNYTPYLSYQVVILTCPEMVSGETYTLDIGGSAYDIEAY